MKIYLLALVEACLLIVFGLSFLVTPTAAQKASSLYNSQLLDAISSRDSQSVDRLLKLGADANAVKPNKNTALIEAALHGDVSIVKNLLAYKANVNARGEMGDTPVIGILVRRQQIPNCLKIVKLLLKYGADANSCNNTGYTALTLVGNRYDLAQLLISNGADVDIAIHGNEMTPLMLAVNSGQFDIARLLLVKGARANIREEKTGKTALHYAVFTEKPAIAKLLIKYGADTSAKDVSGNTPLMLAQALKRSNMVQVLRSHPMTELR